jgi:phosphopantothenoylcysteine decarboxylase/phosphopantothenate--cysteine ligase
VLVSAGPTYEDIDPVRYVGNRSSGRMGFALAAEARRRGAHVTMVAGPTRLEPPAVDELVRVRSAAEMHAAVTLAAPAADVVIMAAAVADYTPARPSEEKMAKSEGPATLVLERTRDILADLGRLPSRAARGAPLLVGFAAETGGAVAKAREKRARKNVDLMVANDVSQPHAGFEVETNEVTIVGSAGEWAVPMQSKDRVAAAILDRVEQLLRTRVASPA